MILDLKNLPFETALLHQIITDLVEQMTSLQEQLALLKAKSFGKSSEKLNKQIDELEHRIEESEFLNEELAQIIEKDEEDIASDGAGIQVPSKKRPKRQKLPDNLERTDVVLNPDPKCPSCGSEKFRTINEDVSEMLEYIPSSFKVIRNIRPRCACINCETIVQAYPASGAIDKGKAGPGLLAHILVQKYCNHFYLYIVSHKFMSVKV